MKQFLLDANNVVTTAFDTDPQPGAVEVTDSIFTSALPRLNRVKYVDGVLTDLPAPAPTSEDVHREQERRIARGLKVTTSTSKVIPVDTRNDKDIRNLNGLSSGAIVRKMNADTTPFVFTGADNVQYTLTPTEMIEVGMSALDWIDKHHKKARELKDTVGGIPSDYASNNTYWPDTANVVRQGRR